MNKIGFLCFADASLGNFRASASQGGYISFLLGENKRHAPIAWQRKKIPQVVNSTPAAETLALQGAQNTATLCRHSSLNLLDSMSSNQYLQ